MKAAPFLIPCGVFLAALIVTGVALRQAPVRTGQAATTSQGGTLSHPDASPDDHSATSLLAEVRRLLRSGDMQGVRTVMLRTAKADPSLFFAMLRDLPYFEGAEDIVTLAAAGLPWRDPASSRIIDVLSNDLWTRAAWEGYIGSRVGKVPDAEVLETASHVNATDGYSPFSTLMEDAAEKRPKEFALLLTTQLRSDVWSQFFDVLMRKHPEMAHDLYASLDGHSIGFESNRFEIPQFIAARVPTAENLVSTLAVIPRSGGGDEAFAVTCAAYSGATPEERSRILDLIGQQPAAMRGNMLLGVLEANVPLPLADLTHALGTLTSGPMQASALAKWMVNQPDLDPDRSWIDQLPTAKLKAKAGEILDQKAQP